MLLGLSEVAESRKRLEAWSLSHTLVAAGCDADSVTVAKLLGEPEKRPRRYVDPEVKKRQMAERVWQRMQEKNDG